MIILPKKNKNYSGFTFMELMIVIAIIGILSTISIISFDPIRKIANLDASVDEVASAINLARGYSLQGKMPVGKSSICGYGFEFTSTSDYRIFYYVDSVNDSSSPDYCNILGNFSTNNPVSTRSLKSNVTLVGPSDLSSTKIYFSIPRATLLNQADTTYTIKLDGSSKQKTVKVNSAGLVESQ